MSEEERGSYCLPIICLNNNIPTAEGNTVTKTPSAPAPPKLMHWAPISTFSTCSRWYKVLCAFGAKNNEPTTDLRGHACMAWSSLARQKGLILAHQHNLLQFSRRLWLHTGRNTQYQHWQSARMHEHMWEKWEKWEKSEITCNCRPSVDSKIETRFGTRWRKHTNMYTEYRTNANMTWFGQHQKHKHMHGRWQKEQKQCAEREDALIRILSQDKDTIIRLLL